MFESGVVEEVEDDDGKKQDEWVDGTGDVLLRLALHSAGTEHSMQVDLPQWVLR